MSLESCLQRRDIWRGKKAVQSGDAVATGFAALDQHLPNGGWPQHALTEILIEDIAYSPLWLLMPALGRIISSRPWQIWIAPPAIPYPPGLSQHGLDLSKILLINTSDPADILWSAEQALRSRACSAVLCWPGRLRQSATRRLQLAAEQGGGLGICFQNESALNTHSMAALKLHCRNTDDGLCIDLIKCRGGPLHQNLMVTHPLSQSRPIPRQHQDAPRKT